MSTRFSLSFNKPWSRYPSLRRRPIGTIAHRQLKFEVCEERNLLSVSPGMIGLVEDTGSSSSDLITTNPSLVLSTQGTLESDSVRIDIDHNQDGVTDGSITSVAVGNQYTYDPRLVDSVFNNAAGTIHMAFRAVELDAAGDEALVSSWQNFEFTLAHPTPVVAATTEPATVNRFAGQATVTITIDQTYDAPVTLNWTPREGTALLGENWTNGTWNDGYLHGAVWVEGHYQDNTWIEEHWENQVWVEGFWTTPVWIEAHQEGGTWVEGAWTASEWVEGHLENPVWVEGHYATEYWAPDEWINQTFVPAGYVQHWLPTYEHQVWKEDHEVDVWVPDRWVEEQYYPAEYDELGVWHDELTIPAHMEYAHFESEFRPMGWYWETVEGHYENGDWLPDRYEGGELVPAHLVQADWVEGHWDGTWVPGEWTAPQYIAGHWEGGTWVDGTWSISEWVAGYYEGGNLVEGHWEQSNWIDSQWVGGTWVPGWWSDQGGELTFEPGELTKTVSLSILPNWFSEGQRVFYVDFYLPGQSSSILCTATVTITA